MSSGKGMGLERTGACPAKAIPKRATIGANLVIVFFIVFIVFQQSFDSEKSALRWATSSLSNGGGYCKEKVKKRSQVGRFHHFRRKRQRGGKCSTSYALANASD